MMIAYTNARSLLLSAIVAMMVFFGTTGTTHAAGDATVISYAVECAQESDLPNWGEWGLGGGDNRTIEPSDVAEFIASSNGACDYASGWSFEWGMDYPYPADSTMGESGKGSVFGPTNAQGVAQTRIFVDSDEGRSTWFRAVTRPGYYGFTGKNEEETVSSEFYCHTDLWHYDNNEVLTIVPDATYYCALFTAKVPGAEPTPTPTPTRLSFPSFGSFPKRNVSFERPVFERPETPQFKSFPTFPRSISRMGW